MKVLTATRQGQGEREGDFCFATEGELVLLGLVCATDRANPVGGCGCGRAFAGLNSHRATTTALVRDLDLSSDELRLAFEAHHTSSGLGPDVLGDQDFADLVAESVEEALHFGRWWPAGTVVGRRLDSVHLRA